MPLLFLPVPLLVLSPRSFCPVSRPLVWSACVSCLVIVNCYGNGLIMLSHSTRLLVVLFHSAPACSLSVIVSKCVPVYKGLAYLSLSFVPFEFLRSKVLV